MSTIASLTPIAGPGTAGSEEFVVNLGGLDRKCTASEITYTVTTNLTAEIAARTAADTLLTTSKLGISGGTMTGALILHGAPVANLDAATKLYVDTGLASKASAAATTLDAATTGVTAAATPISGSTAVATTAYTGAAIREQSVLKKTTVSSTPVTLTNAETGTFEVDHTTAAPVIINLPVISTYANPGAHELRIIDTGGNASTNSITINAGAANSFAGLAGPLVINTNYASVYIANDGTNTWFQTDLDPVSSTTGEGKIQLATGVEATALTNATKAIAPSTLKTTLEAFPYNITSLGSPTHVLVESDTGTLPVTRTLTGVCAITLPDPGTLTNPKLTHFAIYDAGAAETFNITITTAGGNIDGSGDPFVINQDRMGATFIPDATATNWISIANTNGAFSGGASTPWQYNGVDIYFDQEVTIGDTTATNSLFNLDKSTGDVGITFSQSATAKFIMGIDDTDDDFKVSVGGTLGTGDIMEIDSTNSHIGWGVAPGANDKFTIYGKASALSMLTVKSSTGGVAFQNKEDLTTYLGQGVSVGINAPIPSADGININGGLFSDGWKVGLSTTGANITGGKVQLTTANLGFSHTGLRLECTNATNNYALVTAAGGGNVGFGTETPNASSILELSSTTGALLLPRMSTAQEGALTAVNGMIIYNSDTNKVRVYEAGAWTNVI